MENDECKVTMVSDKRCATKREWQKENDKYKAMKVSDKHKVTNVLWQTERNTWSVTNVEGSIEIDKKSVTKEKW